MLSIKIDKYSINKQNLIGKSPKFRTDVAVEANELPVTGTPNNPHRDDFLPYFCLNILQSINFIVKGEKYVVSFSSNVCELTYAPATESTVFVNGYGLSGDPLNDSVPEPGVEVPISTVVKEHLRVCEECYRRYMDLPMSISRHPQIACLQEKILNAYQCASDHGLLEAAPPDLQRNDRLTTESSRTITVEIAHIEEVDRGFDCSHRNVVLESDRGERFGVFDSSRQISERQLETSQTVELWALDLQRITHATGSEKRIAPSTRGPGWKNHTYYGPIQEINHCGETTVILLDIGGGCISAVISDNEAPADLSVGDFVSIQVRLTELIATPP